MTEEDIEEIKAAREKLKNEAMALKKRLEELGEEDAIQIPEGFVEHLESDTETNSLWSGFYNPRKLLTELGFYQLDRETEEVWYHGDLDVWVRPGDGYDLAEFIRMVASEHNSLRYGDSRTLYESLTERR